MIDLKKIVLPETIEVDGGIFYIQTSFKYWLRFLELLADKNTMLSEFDFMYTDEKPKNRINALAALIYFSNPPRELPRTDRAENGGMKVLDYFLDADFIYAAFLEQYGIDLVESNMHWYKFQALIFGLHETKLNEIIGYRLYENTSGKTDAYTRQMEKLRSAWELPQTSGEDTEDTDLKAFEEKLYSTKKIAP